MRRNIVALCVVFALAPVWAHEGVFTKPIRFIIPYPAGGPTDLTGRLFAERLAKYVGQVVVVENVPGAQGVIAAQKLIQSPTDGHSIYLGTSSTQIIFPILSARRGQRLPFDAHRDFAAISPLVTTELLVIASAKTPVASFEQLVQTLKSQPSALSYGSDGSGSLTHLGGELIDQAAGTRAVHVPYKGTAEYSQALLRGDVQFGVMGAVGAASLLRQGAVRVLAVAGARRSPQLPGVPTTAELGYPRIDLSSWFGVFMKGDTPRQYVDAMAEAIRRASNDPDLMRRLVEAGVEPAAAATPEQFAALVDMQFERWKATIDRAAIKFDN